MSPSFSRVTPCAISEPRKSRCVSVSSLRYVQRSAVMYSLSSASSCQSGRKRSIRRSARSNPPQKAQPSWMAAACSRSCALRCSAGLKKSVADGILRFLLCSHLSRMCASSTRSSPLRAARSKSCRLSITPSRSACARGTHTRRFARAAPRGCPARRCGRPR